ncbi:classical arabinogalactan protein 9-like [Monomorium pharaonis]|uniref:classical arabinogalactan protein 9-like n=1 Tax=Monomorium pharaonis TaxID=307658 RepID=UPI00174681C7|nr:classical arabinogalactan protein 9-like [Monomorium pharaonis]
MSHCSMASRSKLMIAMFGGEISSSSGDEGTAWKRRPKESTPPLRERKASFLAQLPPPSPRGRRSKRKPPEGYAAKASPAPLSTPPAPPPPAPPCAAPLRPLAAITPRPIAPPTAPLTPPTAPPIASPPTPSTTPPPAPPTAPPGYGYRTARPPPLQPEQACPVPIVGYTPPLGTGGTAEREGGGGLLPDCRAATEIPGD